MALRGSLPSTLNSRINTGPDINITKRTGLNLAKGISGGHVPQREFTDSTAHDIEENRIMLNECDTEHTAQIQTCIGKDTVCYGSHDSFTRNTAFDLGIPDFGCGRGLQYQVDARHSQYIRDVGDARCDLEYFLRTRQIVLFFPNCEAENFQPHLHIRTKKDNSSFSTRRVSIIFNVEDVKFQGNLYNPTPENGARTGFPFFKATSNKGEQHNVFALKIRASKSNAEVTKDVLNYTSVLNFVKDVFDSIKKPQLAYVSTVRNDKEVMPPKTLAFSGMSLTYGYMSPKNGDTAITANLFSARTDRNGPFRAHGGDDAFWLYNCELEMFDKQTHCRHERPVLTPHLLNYIVTNIALSGASIRIPGYNPPDADQCMRPDPLAEAPGSGNKQYPSFVLASAPHSHSLCGFSTTTSLCDLQRRIGKVISGGPPSSQIDWINGAGSEL
tara:strand:+ start:1537 stop:2862 length:1326 start_codon:yes stop_codon:yes gene_type:complete